MPGEPFPPGSEEGPENADFSSSEQQPDDPGKLAPIGASTPGAWPADPDEEDVDLPGGGQYPDDIFGATPGDEAPIALPEDAFAGGLADVEYGSATDSPDPLPPPPEPQNLAEISIDPLPLTDQADAQPPAGDDMFSVDELIGEPAEPQPAGGDMFSVDELIGEPVEFDQAAVAGPPAVERPAPLAMPEPDDMSEQPASSEPLPMPEPSAPPEHLASPASLAMPEPFPTQEPLESPEPAATSQPLPLPEPLEPDEPPVIAETLAAPEPPPIPEPLAESAPPADLPAPVDSFVLPDPIPNAEPVAAAEAAAPDEPPVLAPHGIAESQAETPTSDFGFADIDVGDVGDAETAAAPESEMPTMEPLAIDLPVEQAPDEPADEPASSVVNPYAQVADEAEVVNPAMSVEAGFELPNTEIAEGETMETVNPYAEVSPEADEADEAEVVNPAMSLSASAPVEPEAAPEVLTRTDTEYAPEPVATGSTVDDSYATSPEGGFEEDYAMPAAYGETSYAEVSTVPLPATDRTVSVAPPGMENLAAGGLVVAGAKGKAKSKSKNAAARGGGRKLSIGKGKKGKKGAETLQPTPIAEQPQTVTPMSQQDEAIATMADAPTEFAVPPPDPMAADSAYAPAPAEPAGMTYDPAAIPTPALTAFPGPTAPQAAQPAAAPVKAKQGKSLADSLLGKVEPGQRHKMLGIPIGKPTPLPGDPRDAVQPPPPAAMVPVAPAVKQEFAPAPPEFTAPVEPPPQSFIEPAAEAPLAPTMDASGFPPAPAVQSPVASLTPQPPVAEFPAPASVPAGAEVIESLEAAAHKLGKTKRGRKQKQPKQPKVAQGKSLADSLLGKVEPGQRHKMFGIPIGKPTPLPGDPRDAVQPPPPAPTAEPAPPAWQPPAEQAAPATPAWQPPAEPPVAVEPQPFAPVPPAGGQVFAPPPADSPPAAPPAAYPPAGQPRYVEPPVQQRPAASAAGENSPFSSPGDTATTFPAAPQTAWPAPTPQAPYEPLAITAFPVSQPEYAVTAVLDQPVPAVQAVAPFPEAVLGSGAVAAAQPQTEPPTAIPMQAVSPNLIAAAPAEASVFKLARWLPRATAQVIDVVIAAGILLLIGRFLNFGPLAENGVMQGSFDIAGATLAVVVVAVYQGGMLAFGGGQTLGKRVAKIRVVREDGKPIDLGYAMLREGAAKVLVSAVTAGVYGVVDALWPAFDKQNRALHDIIVKSRVVEQ